MALSQGKTSISESKHMLRKQAIDGRILVPVRRCLLTLYNKYPIAKELYENAIVLGGRRMSNDVWPMDVSKYEEYPQTMISSCEKLIGNESIFIDHNN